MEQTPSQLLDPPEPMVTDIQPYPQIEDKSELISSVNPEDLDTPTTIHDFPFSETPNSKLLAQEFWGLVSLANQVDRIYKDCSIY
jgi:hypothetical protein